MLGPKVGIEIAWSDESRDPTAPFLYVRPFLDIELLEKTGIDHLVIVPFTEFFANQTAEEYIRDFLVEKFRPHTIIIGYDHRFGKERSGDYKLMEEKAATYHYRLKEISEHILNTIKVSSTNIRK